MRRAAALALCLLAFAPARAREIGLSQAFDDCMDRASGVTAAMVMCTDAEIKVQDARLNKAYRTLMATLATQRRAQLQEAQRAWLRFQELNCKFHYDPDGGTLAQVAAVACVMTGTALRAKELESFIDP